LTARFFAAGGKLDRSNLFLVHGFNAYSGNIGAHHYVFLPKLTGWPKGRRCRGAGGPWL
jgi:hypothetical protein